jgi:hypothetical protein
VHGVVAAAGFAVAFLSLALTVVMGGLTTPAHTKTGDDWVCVRSSRHEDYATVNLAIGSPPRIFKLLLKLDSIDTLKAVSVENDELLASSSLRCNPATKICSDFAILESDGQGRSVYLDSFAFAEGSPLTAALGLDGTFSLSQDTEYLLTSTHLCFRPDTGDYYYNSPFYEGTTVAAWMSTTSGTLVYNTTDCGEADLFPATASHERTWLALATQFLYESSMSTLSARREVVQTGIDCVDNTTTVAKLYELDCELDLYATCRYRSSLPYRVVSTSNLWMVTSTTAIIVEYEADDSLKNSLDNSDIGTGSLRFVLLLLIAFVVYSRSERKSSSAVFVLLHAKNVLNSKERHYSKLIGVVGDATVGILAIVCRATVVGTKAGNLIADGAADCVISEVIGLAASICHFLLRNVVLEFRGVHHEAPLTKLGGSAAMSDAGAAALVSVATSPIAASALSFDSIARLFAATFLLVYVLHRLLFSATACALMASTTASSPLFQTRYSLTLGVSYVLWVAESASIGWSLGRFFIGPTTFSLLRMSTADFSSTSLLVAAVCAGVHGLSVHRVLLRLRRASFSPN